MVSQKQITSVVIAQNVFFDRQHSKTYYFRKKSLLKLRDAIRKYEPEISKALYADLHKSEFEAYATEIGFVLEEISYHLKNLKKWMKAERMPSGLASFPSKSRLMSEPLGRVLIIAPWNYPFQLIMAPLVGAISAGNTVILKPSEISVNTSKLIAKIIGEIFLPEHVAVFEGDASVTQELLKLKLDHIFFTGSPRVGKIVMQEAAKQLIPVTLELGGKSPCIVDETVNIKLAAKRIIWGKLLNAGQTCIAPDYLLVHHKIKLQLLEALSEAITQFYGQNPETSGEYPRIISRANAVRLESLMEGAIVFRGGKVDVDSRYVEPTILVDVDPDSQVMQQEIFGPILPVLTYNETPEIIRFINGRHKPLALYCFSENREFIRRVLNEIPAGGVTINDTLMHIANNRLPFGGIGNSGMGHYHGKYSFDLFSHKKSVLVRGTWMDVPLRYAPFRNKLKYIKWIMK